MSTSEHGAICGAPNDSSHGHADGVRSTYCMAPADHHGEHVYTARDDMPVADDGYCPAQDPAGGEHCERAAGHDGEHRAAAPISGGTLQRLATWTS